MIKLYESLLSINEASEVLMVIQQLLWPTKLEILLLLVELRCFEKGGKAPLVIQTLMWCLTVTDFWYLVIDGIRQTLSATVQQPNNYTNHN